MVYKDLTPEQKLIADGYGFISMFSERETVNEAYNYAIELAKNYGSDSAGAVTAVQVLANTCAVKIARLFTVITNQAITGMKVVESVSDDLIAKCRPKAYFNDDLRICIPEGADTPSFGFDKETCDHPSQFVYYAEWPTEKDHQLTKYGWCCSLCGISRTAKDMKEEY